MQLHDIDQNRKSVQDVAESDRPCAPEISRSKPRRNRDKNHADYWKPRLFRNTYQHDGEVVQCGNLAVKLQHRGQRETFSLKSGNRDMAAREAKEIFTFALANGMAAAVAKFKPEVTQRVESPTLGQFLAEIKAKAGLRPKTFKAYANALRKIVADSFGIDGGKAKFDYRSGGHAAWIARIESIRLDALTPAKVQAWKVSTLEEARPSPVQLMHARRNVNSFIRQAKSLFSSKATRFLSGINLPNPLPFAGIAFEKPGSMRYQSRIDCHALVVAARNELAVQHPEQYKIFLLAIGAGLRKAEIDTLTWRQIDWQNQTIWIGATDHFTPKTEDSQGTVDVDTGVLDELRRLMPQSQGDFVLASSLLPRPSADHQFYRASREFDELNRWLRSKGVTAQKPLHELRKEFGSLVCQQAGIFAASTQLRHGDIRVTASYYVDKKQRVTVRLEGLINQSGVKLVPAGHQ